MLAKIGIGLAVVLGIVVALVASQPDEFHVERTATVGAPPAVVHSILDDFHNWSEWSPWDKLDPNLKREFSGPESGVGAGYAWVGNDDVGQGSMRITQSEPPNLVRLDLDFVTPFEAHNQVSFSLAPAAEGTRVTWAMDGDNDFVAKAFGLVMDVDDMVGKDFEAGLASLGALAAKQARELEAERPEDGAEQAPPGEETPEGAPAGAAGTEESPSDDGEDEPTTSD